MKAHIKVEASIDSNTHNSLLCCRAQKTTKSDDGRKAGEIQEEHGSNRLKGNGILEVTQVPWRFAFDVVDKATKQPVQRNIYVRDAVVNERDN